MGVKVKRTNMVAIMKLGKQYDLAVDVWSRGLDYAHYIRFATTLDVTPLEECAFDAIYNLVDEDYKS